MATSPQPPKKATKEIGFLYKTRQQAERHHPEGEVRLYSVEWPSAGISGFMWAPSPSVAKQELADAVGLTVSLVDSKRPVGLLGGLKAIAEAPGSDVKQMAAKIRDLIERERAKYHRKVKEKAPPKEQEEQVAIPFEQQDPAKPELSPAPTMDYDEQLEPPAHYDNTEEEEQEGNGHAH